MVVRVSQSLRCGLELGPAPLGRNPSPPPWSPSCPFFLDLPPSETWEKGMEGVPRLYLAGWEGDGQAPGLATAWPPP